MCVHVCYAVQSTLFKIEVTLNLQESGKKISTRMEEYASIIELLGECGVSVYGKYEIWQFPFVLSTCYNSTRYGRDPR